MSGRVPEEQRLYARWLARGSRAGLGVLIAGFLAYVFGILEPHVPLHELPSLWTHPVAHYRALTAAPAGGEWLALVHRGDYLNLVGIAILALTSALCFARIVPSLLARGDRLQAGLAVAQVLVLLAAASGILVAGH
jgi:hypothetical protein